MSHYWAEFRSADGETFRLDTRIYLKDIDTPEKCDSCIGAIVGKNPGSAKRSTPFDGFQAINLDGDRLLPTVRSIITKAYSDANTPLPERGYVQVLNLFYICDSNISQAIRSIKEFAEPPLCNSEAGTFPWVWYVWGGESDNLKLYKERFKQVNASQDRHFFYDPRAKEFKIQRPEPHDFAKHTQGLKHEYVVPNIARIISNGQP